jgi:hypothetical protein
MSPSVSHLYREVIVLAVTTTVFAVVVLDALAMPRKWN